MKISVCMATYNGSTYLGAQVSSILQQLSPDDELIVVDDGSSDNTLALLRDIGDRRIQVHGNPRNLGPAHSFGRALALATGDVVFLSDQDDIWLPGKVEAMLKVLAHNDLVLSDCSVTDGELKVLHPSFFKLRGARSGLWHNLVRNSYLGCCMAMRRELLIYALPLPARVPIHDWWLGLVAEAFGRPALLNEPLILYRRHGANASSAAEPSRASRMKQLRWRIHLCTALLRRRWQVGRGLPATLDAGGDR